MSGCALCGERDASWLLKAVMEPASAMEAQREFHSGMELNMVGFQSGEDLALALGISSLWGLFFCHRAGRVDYTNSTESGKMVICPFMILYSRARCWSWLRSARECHLRSHRSVVTLVIPYKPWPGVLPYVVHSQSHPYHVWDDGLTCWSSNPNGTGLGWFMHFHSS